MKDNLKPHEYIRKVMEVFQTFEHEGDLTWPLRQIRELSVTYMRAVMMRYKNVTDVEAHELTKLFLFEAAKRHEYDLDEDMRFKYDLLVELSSKIEDTEDGICSSLRLFDKGSLTRPKLAEDYEGNESYQWLKLKGTFEGTMEIMTVLRENSELVHERCQEVLSDMSARLAERLAATVAPEATVPPPTEATVVNNTTVASEGS